VHGGTFHIAECTAKPPRLEGEKILPSTSVGSVFLGRPVDVIEGHGNYRGPYEFDLDFAVVPDKKNGLFLSFVWNLQD